MTQDPFDEFEEHAQLAATTEWEPYEPQHPDWLYPLIGEVASSFALMEYAILALAMQWESGVRPSRADVLKVLGGAQSTRDALKTKKGDAFFEKLKNRYFQRKDERDRFAHSVLWWTEADGPFSDYWSLEHPKSSTTNVLGDRAEEEMRVCISRIQRTTVLAWSQMQQP